MSFGAEIFVLEDVRGVGGMDGSSGVDGDDIYRRELSSARTTIAGVPQVVQNAKDVL